ncbi:MAG TPA: hypothetical protein VNU68_21315 [Verrucomicrobiae bacterium]|nr:hypothetical protein [Verrucomicrobiae bacterium]
MDLKIPAKDAEPEASPSRMTAFRLDSETKTMLEANARAANCTQTDMVKYLIRVYYEQHVAKIPRPFKPKRGAAGHS